MRSVKTKQGGNQKSRFATGFLVATICLTLAGCDQAEKTRQVIDQRADEAHQTLEAAQKPKGPVAYDPLVVTNKLWNGGAALRMQRGMPLPARYETPRGITLVSSDNMTLNEIAASISAQTGIPMRLSALSLAVRGGGGAGFNAAAASSASPAASNEAMPIAYEGPLSGLLERMSAFFGVSWRYDGSSISMSRYETRIFAIEALPGSQQINEGMQDDAGGGASSGSSSGSSGSSSSNTITQNSKVTMDLKYWDELSQVVNSIIAGQGTAVISPAMGTVTVTTTPDVMTTVADYISKENKRQSRQIAINVQIYSVNLGQSEDFDVAFTGFLKNLNKFSGINYTTGSSVAPTLANPAFTNTSANNFGTLSVAILNGPNDHTAHAGDVFNALSTIGDTTNIAQFPMVTLNNHPVSRRVGTDTSYIASVTSTTTTSTASSTAQTATVSTIHDGFSIQLTPRLLDDGRILLDYSLSLIGIDSLPTNTTYGVTLPVTDNRIFVQQSALRSGQTLIIGGVDQEKMTQNNSGIGSPDNFLLGGGTSSYNNHFMMFMAITPQVMDVGPAEHG